MQVTTSQLIPLIFPPGAGGHFLWHILTLHPSVMPLDKDQTMQKLLKDKSLHDQVERIKKNIAPHDQWQEVEAHGYYVAPPDYSKNEMAQWEVNGDVLNIDTGDDYFFDKINQPHFLYGMIVHRTQQFPLLHKLSRKIGFDNFIDHVNNSKKKVANIFHQVDYSSWQLDDPCFKFEPDKFYYDWPFAEQSLHKLYEYLNLNCDNDIVDATKAVWHFYRSNHCTL